MIPVTDLRSGTTFKEGKDIYEVISYEHIKLGRGSATIKVKVHNLRSGAIVEKSFTSGNKVEAITLDNRKAQFLYKQGDEYVFMNSTDFEQFNLSAKIIGERAKLLTEGLDVKILCYQDEPLTLDLPIKMEFTIVDTPPGVKGNSSVNIWKDAQLETGFKVKVPLFVEIGDRIRVDTRSGQYMERVGK